MKTFLFFFFPCLAVVLAACTKPVRVTADDQFKQLADNFIESYLELNPEEATLLGDHRYDDRLDDYSPEGIQRAIDLRKTYLDSLEIIKVEELSQDNKVDYDIFRHNLEWEIFAYEKLRGWEWNPLTYNVGNAVYSLIARDFAPLQDRMKNLAERLSKIPDYLEQAKKNLKNPPAIHTETAITQNAGNLSLLQETLNPFIDSLPKALQEEIIPLRDVAVLAVMEYGTWLKNDLLPRSKGEFRLGIELYDQKLGYVLDSDITREQILARAEEELKKTTDELYATAAPLYQTFFPGKKISVESEEGRAAVIKAVLTRLSEDRPTNETIVEKAKEDLTLAEQFVREKNIATIPTEPVEIIVMPEFQRGVAVAYCDSPGPLEDHGKTFYAISPTPTDWPAAKAESFYKEYNNYMLKNLTVHEAMPGHYLQLVTGNRFKAPTLIRGIFQSGIFAEGWATYCEQIMADAGFGGPEMKIQQLKMRLRLVINAVIDQKIHTEGMTEREAMDLMMKKGFQEEGEAAGKWRRACMTSAQLSTYFVGNILMNDLRTRFEKHAGELFNLKEFHDKVLSFGTISPKYLPGLLNIPDEADVAAQAR